MSLNRVVEDSSPSLGGPLNANGQNITNINNLSSQTVSDPLSPDVFANTKNIVISGPAATSPSSAAGAAAPTPVTNVAVQIASHTFAQQGVVHYESTSDGAKMAIEHQTSLVGPRGAAYHEPNDPPKPLVPVTSTGTFSNPITDTQYNSLLSTHFRLIDGVTHGAKLEPSQGLGVIDLANRWQNVCVNVLDPIKSQFNFGIVSAFRNPAYLAQIANDGTNTNFSTASAAAITLGDNDSNIAMWKWIYSSGLPFTQAILFQGGSFIHISLGQDQGPSRKLLYSATGTGPFVSGNQIPPQFLP